ncbi:MAG: TonB-dependent receptor [Sphingomonadales bacterium]|nr:TonB-dependent receptor [Sphingomonadales bacterium]
MKYLFLLGCSLAVVSPAWAQEKPDEIIIADLRITPPTEITVIATGSSQRIDQTGQSIAIIGAGEIASLQGPDITRVLERAPGVTFTRNGGLGGFTGVRLRGSEAEQVLVLVDGVRVADVASPGGGTDFGNLLAGGLGKVEVLRGSNSVVWGSQAMGGVIALTSREVQGVEASAEYGAHDSFDGSAVAGLAGDHYALSLNGGYSRSDGISQAATGTEADGFRQWRIGGRGRLDLAEGLSASVTGRYADSRLEIDGFPAPNFSFADTPEYQTTRDISGRAGLRYASDSLTLDGGFALSDTRRTYYDPTFGPAANYATYGRSERADLTGHLALPSSLALDFGADSEWSRFSTLFDPEVTARLSSGHALLGYYGDGVTLAGGVRVDDHSRFGTHWTFGANGSVAIAEGWRVRASFGQGFKAPTLFQLLSNYGNTRLVPEQSDSYDIGIEKGDRNGALHFAVTAFRRDSRNLIDFVSCFGVTTGICTGRPFGTYDNVGKARAEGVEVEADAKPSERFAVHAAYSFTKAVNRLTGKDLARRPRHALTLAADWRSPLHDLTLGADLLLVGDSFDSTKRIDGHALVTLRASLPVTEQFDLFGRIENVANSRYESVAGYGTEGRAGYVGVRARF